jgi:hypothetical protein
MQQEMDLMVSQYGNHEIIIVSDMIILPILYMMNDDENIYLDGKMV